MDSALVQGVHIMSKPLENDALVVLRAIFDLIDANVCPTLDLVSRLWGIRPSTSFALITHLREEGLHLDRPVFFEGQVTALADDIAQQIHDCDDGMRAGQVALEEIDDLEISKEMTSKISPLMQMNCCFLNFQFNFFDLMSLQPALNFLSNKIAVKITHI